MPYRKHFQLFSYDTISELPTNSENGQMAVTNDSLAPLKFDGTNWVALTDMPLKRITSTGSAPSITMAMGAGSGSSGSVVGTNSAGIITITTGVTLTTDGNLFTITLGDSATFQNKMILQIQGTDAASIAATTSIFPAVQNAASNIVKMRGLGLAINTTYTFSYHIIGY